MLSSDRSTQAVRDATRTISPEDLQGNPEFDQVDLATTLHTVTVTSPKSSSEDPQSNAAPAGNGVKLDETISKADLEEVKHTDTELNEAASATHTTIPTGDRASEVREKVPENGESGHINEESSGATQSEAKVEPVAEKRPKKNVLVSRGVSGPTPRHDLNGAEDSNGPTTPQREEEHRARMKEWEASKLLRFADETGGTLYETMYTSRLHYAASNGSFETIVEEAPEGRRFPCCTIS